MPASVAGGIGSTIPRQESRWPSQAASRPRRSSGRVLFFFEIQRIGAGDPMFGSFTIDPQVLEGLANGLGAYQPGGPALLDTLFGNQSQRPQASFVPKIVWGTTDKGLQSTAIN